MNEKSAYIKSKNSKQYMFGNNIGIIKQHRNHLFFLVLSLILWLPILSQMINRPLDSDTFYLTSFFQDVFVDRRPINNWNFTQLRGLFPDMIIFYPLLGLFWHVDLGYAYAGYGFIVVVLSALLLNVLSKNTWTGLLFSFFCGISLINAPYVFHWFLLPNFHGGTWLAGLCMLASTLWLLFQPSFLHMILFSLIFGISIFSDALFIIQFALPILIAAMILPFFDHHASKALGYLFCGASIGFLINNGIEFIIDATQLVNLRQALNLDFVSIIQLGFNWEGLPKLFFDLNILFRQAPLLAFLTVSGILALLGMGAYSIKIRHTRLCFMCVFGFIQILFSLLVPALLYFWPDPRGFGFAFRYMYPVILTPCIALSFSLANKMIQFQEHKIGRWLQVGLIVIGYFIFRNHPAHYQLKLPQTDLSKCIDHIAQMHNIRAGASRFWQALQTTYMNRSGVRVLDYSENLTMRSHLNNEAWYVLDKPDFVIQPGFNAQVLERKLGYPKEKFACFSNEIWLYRK